MMASTTAMIALARAYADTRDGTGSAAGAGIMMVWYATKLLMPALHPRL